MCLVLHPGLKLEYFRQQEWKEEWINIAEKLVHDEYTSMYEGKAKGCNAAQSGMASDRKVSLLRCVPYIGMLMTNTDPIRCRLCKLLCGDNQEFT